MPPTSSLIAALAPTADSALLPLEPGDRLSRSEFERRYSAMPHVKKAELIEGVVYMPSPVRLHRHGRPHSRLIGWLCNYEAETPGVLAGDNATVRLDHDNEPQPDALLMIDPQCGGQARISSDDYVQDAPEWIGEVAASSASFDLNTKSHVYRRNGVREYVVWRLLEGAIDWHVLRDGEFVRKLPDSDGILRSETLPGLWLDPAALLAGDMARVLDVARQGVASPEHAAFVRELARRRPEAPHAGPT